MKWDRLPGKQVFCGPGNQNTKLINKGDPGITQARRAMELQWQITQSRPRDRHKTFDARASKTTTKGLDRVNRRDTDVLWHRKTTPAKGIRMPLPNGKQLIPNRGKNKINRLVVVNCQPPTPMVNRRQQHSVKQKTPKDFKPRGITPETTRGLGEPLKPRKPTQQLAGKTLVVHVTHFNVNCTGMQSITKTTKLWNGRDWAMCSRGTGTRKSQGNRGMVTEYLVCKSTSIFMSHD